MIRAKILAIGVLMSVTVGCATDDPNRKAKTGAAIGAVAGAILGNQSNSKNGKVVGAAVGALTGAAVGHYMDKQQQKLEQQLAAERHNSDITLTRIDEDTIRLDVSSEASFDVNSARIQADFRNSLNKMSSIIGEYQKTAVHVVGHTDSTGSAQYNQSLSEKRAGAVGRYLSTSGVKRSRLRMVGHGEARPIATNSSSQGRSKNRRVEIFLKAIVEGRENQAFQPPA